VRSKSPKEEKHQVWATTKNASRGEKSTYAKKDSFEKLKVHDKKRTAKEKLRSPRLRRFSAGGRGEEQTVRRGQSKLQHQEGILKETPRGRKVGT